MSDIIGLSERYEQGLLDGRQESRTEIERLRSAIETLRLSENFSELHAPIRQKPATADKTGFEQPWVCPDA